MKRSVLSIVLLAFVFSEIASAQKPITLEQVLSAPFPSDLFYDGDSAKISRRVLVWRSIR